jgi:O-antigen/teichoic acid export membrane protein
MAWPSIANFPTDPKSMSITPSNSGDSPSLRNWGTLLHFVFFSFGYIALRAVLNPVQIKVLTSLLSPEQYGMLTLITIAAWELAHIASAGHYEFLARRLPGQAKTYQREVLALVWRYFGSFVAALAVVVVTALLLFQPAKFTLRPIPLVIAGTCSVLLVFLFQRIYFLSARAEWMRVRTLQLIWSDTWFLPILIVAAFVSITLDIVLVCWLVWLLVASVLAYRWVKGDAGGRSTHSVRIGEVLRFGVPLLPMMLGLSLIGLLERYLLAFMRDVEAVARYTLCFNIALIVYAVGAAVLDLFVPEFNKECNRVADGKGPKGPASEALKALCTAMLRYSLLIASTGGLFLLLCGRQLIAIVSQPAYGSAAQIVPFLALVPLFYLLWILFNRILMAQSSTRVIGIATLVITAVNVGLNIVLIPYLGEIGCALAFTISLALLALFTGAYVRVWRWINWTRLHAGRLTIVTAVNGAGIYVAQAMLGQYALICVVLASGWCLLCIVALRLVHWDDWSALRTPSLSEGRSLGSPSP